MPGIEAAGTVGAVPVGSGLAPGQKVVAMMGDLGHTYDGGLDQAPQSHDDMDQDRATGMLVVRVRH